MQYDDQFGGKKIQIRKKSDMLTYLLSIYVVKLL